MAETHSRRTLSELVVLEASLPRTIETPIIVDADHPLRWVESLSGGHEAMAETPPGELISSLRNEMHVSQINFNIVGAITASLTNLLADPKSALRKDWSDLRLAKLNNAVIIGSWIDNYIVDNSSECSGIWNNMLGCSAARVYVFNASEGPLSRYIMEMATRNGRNGVGYVCGMKDGYLVAGHRKKLCYNMQIRPVRCDAASLEAAITDLLNRQPADSDACCFDGTRIYILPRCLTAWRTRVNIFRPHLMTTTMERDMVESFDNGHDLLIPSIYCQPDGLDPDPDLMPESIRDGTILSLLNVEDLTTNMRYWNDLLALERKVGNYNECFYIMLSLMRHDVRSCGNTTLCPTPAYTNAFVAEHSRYVYQDQEQYDMMLLQFLFKGTFHSNIRICVEAEPSKREALDNLVIDRFRLDLCGGNFHNYLCYDAEVVTDESTRDDVMAFLHSIAMPTIFDMCRQTLDDVFKRVTPRDTARWNNWLCDT